MAITRKARVPMTEQIRLINECRQSGMTDADWCRENDIAVSTFYNWVSRCRKAAADQIPAPNYGHCEIPRSKQDVVPDHLPEQHIASQMHQTNLDCINRREFAICTDFFRHFAGDFLPPCRDSLPPRQFS